MRSSTSCGNIVVKRTLTPDEKKLWRQVTRDDKKLRPVEDDEKETPPARIAKPAKKPAVKIRPELPPPPAKKSTVELGRYADIDKNTANKFRRGDYTIDATLDLHGYNREKARTALTGFIRAHYERGSRCLLIVTGKGIKTSPEGPRAGILREALPGWLAADNCAPYILALDVAKPKHGGSGAYYVLLRRKR